MYNSVLQFIEKDIKKIEGTVRLMLAGEKDADHLSGEVLDATTNLARSLVGEIYGMLDAAIRDSAARKEKWHIERRAEPKELLDVCGTVRFTRTGYRDKKTGEYACLLDRVLGLSGHQRITMGAAAAILEECAQTSYRKGGTAASPRDPAGKQAVKRLVHDTVIDFPVPEPKEKKKLSHLYIIADEDHVAAQFWHTKGDLAKDLRGRSINTLMPKLVCVYEGVANESGEKSKNPRHRLVGKRYFSGIYRGGDGNARLWDEVRDYIHATYDHSVLERVYIIGDGAAWIKAGLEIIEDSRFVLDKYHMMKHINASAAHLLDSAGEVKAEMWECVNGNHAKRLWGLFEKILSVTEPGGKRDEIEAAYKYFRNNWGGISIRKREPARLRCCAEGQVSHVLSARMSSRPMGWTEHGCDQMAKIRAYHYNGGKIIDLLRHQREKAERERRRREDAALIAELRQRGFGWDYEISMNRTIPGLDRQSMRWMKDLVGRAIGA